MSSDIKQAIADLRREAEPVRGQLARIHSGHDVLWTKEALLRAQLAEIQAKIVELRAECSRKGHVGARTMSCIICGTYITGGWE